jgi:hypothetical protein
MRYHHHSGAMISQRNNAGSDALNPGCIRDLPILHRNVQISSE